MSFELTSTPGPNQNPDTAWACTVYSMVPIVFVPFAFVVSGWGYMRAGRSSPDSNRFLFYAGLSSFILAVQLLLWWLLYFIPKIGI